MLSQEQLMENKCVKLKAAALAIISIPAHYTYESLPKALKELESEFDRVAPHSINFKDKKIWD